LLKEIKFLAKSVTRAQFTTFTPRFSANNNEDKILMPGDFLWSEKDSDRAVELILVTNIITP
jgi:hypothetical protein